ncbi:MAG: NfeD family protein, partial [Burkholderiales bacterium]
MADSTLWWLMTGAAVVLELLTGTFYLLMLAIGLAAGAVAAHLGLDLTG